jgi:cytochrome c oxidase subunit 3
MSAHTADPLVERFQDLETQTHAGIFGMWVFLASEVLFFGVLFTLYAVYRADFPDAFREAAGHTDLALGTANTYLLVSASWFVALSVGAIREDRVRKASWLLGAAAVLGVVFLGLKALEYAHHFAEGLYPGRYYSFAELPDRGAKAFFSLYYAMTGLHALHVLIGIVLLAWLAIATRRGRFDSRYHTPLELGGMYWHFVDLVWLFLWPIFYLLR